MEYEGKISGIGNATTRQNEITADDLAILRNYINGWEYGIINREGWNFNAYKEGNSVVVEKGIMFAFGYFGILPETIKIPFIKTSAVQYRFIYAEIDRSVIPNTFTIKVKNNQGSDKVKPTTFRQDYLSAVKTGVFQLPLWRVQLDNEGIADIDGLTDLRQELGLLKDCIKQVKKTHITTGRVTKEVKPEAKFTTANALDKSERVATTLFVHQCIRKYLDEPMIKVTINLLENMTATPKELYMFAGETSYMIITCPKDYLLRFGATEEVELFAEVISEDLSTKTIELSITVTNIVSDSVTIQIRKG